MGDAVRLQMTGELDRDANGLNAGELRSLLPSTNGDEVTESVELVEHDASSLVPSEFAAGLGDSGLVIVGCAAAAGFPLPGVN